MTKLAADQLLSRLCERMVRQGRIEAAEHLLCAAQEEDAVSKHTLNQIARNVGLSLRWS